MAQRFNVGQGVWWLADLQRWLAGQKRVSANIHYPVDWVLLRDATRTLMASVRLIRYQGLKHRLEEPETFVSRINGLCIKMTQAWNRQEAQVSQRLRQQTLRQMDRLVGTVRNHARRYRELLDAHWAQTQGRIGIVKHVFLGGRMRCKGFAHGQLTVSWTVLAHPLWVLARLPQVQATQAKRRAA